MAELNIDLLEYSVMDHQDIIFLVGLFMGSTGVLIFQAVRPRRAPREMPPLPPRTMEQEMQYRQYLSACGEPNALQKHYDAVVAKNRGPSPSVDIADIT